MAPRRDFAQRRARTSTSTRRTATVRRQSTLPTAPRLSVTGSSLAQSSETSSSASSSPPPSPAPAPSTTSTTAQRRASSPVRAKSPPVVKATPASRKRVRVETRPDAQPRRAPRPTAAHKLSARVEVDTVLLKVRKAFAEYTRAHVAHTRPLARALALAEQQFKQTRDDVYYHYALMRAQKVHHKKRRRLRSALLDVVTERESVTRALARTRAELADTRQRTATCVAVRACVDACTHAHANKQTTVLSDNLDLLEPVTDSPFSSLPSALALSVQQQAAVDEIRESNEALRVFIDQAKRC